MHPFFQDFFDRLTDLHQDIRAALDGLPQEALDWSPTDDTPSFAVLSAHISGAERYWIGDVAGQDPSARDRDAEFRTRGVPSQALLHRLNAAENHAHQTLKALTIEDLPAERLSTRDGRNYSVAWALLHALEHTAIHLGHLQILRQTWDTQTSEDRSG